MENDFEGATGRYFCAIFAVACPCPVRPRETECKQLLVQNLEDDTPVSIYQWENRKNRILNILWQRVMNLTSWLLRLFAFENAIAQRSTNVVSSIICEYLNEIPIGQKTARKNNLKDCV